MPNLIEEVELSVDWADINRRVRHDLPSDSTRNPGPHVTEILRKVALELKMFDPSSAEYVEDIEVMPLRMVLGMAFEEWIVGLYPDMLWQPGQFAHKGISGSPDGFSTLTIDGMDVPVIEEFKLTWKSCRRIIGPEIFQQWMWMHQTRAYCKFLDTRYVRLHTCFVNGDYEKGRIGTPKYKRWLIEFSDREIDRTWEILSNG